MTKTLTEQWKDGTLSMGYYYVSRPPRYGVEAIKYLDDDCSFGLGEDIIQEVLAPVPSYERAKDLDRLEQFCELLLVGEKQEWESIVKRGNRKEMAKWLNERKNETIERIEKQLDIATKALKKLTRDCNKWEIARKALKEMEGVK